MFRGQYIQLRMKCKFVIYSKLEGVYIISTTNNEPVVEFSVVVNFPFYIYQEEQFSTEKKRKNIFLIQYTIE
jgi:hypothetical protein